MEHPRINQYLVSVGLAESRRKADEIIKQGKVSVNKTTLTDLSYRVTPSDRVTVDGQHGQKRDDIYIVYNKPSGEVCSHKHQSEGLTIFDSLPKSFARLKIAGRLDKESRGMIVLSSDGQFIQSLSHPSQEKSKIYIVKVNQKITGKLLEQLNAGVKLEDGVSTMKASKIKPDTLRIEMQEGRNRQIRRSLDALGAGVIDLERVGIGKYSNTHIAESKFVFVNPNEIL